MIQVIDPFNTATLEEVQGYLNRCPAPVGTCQEHDVRWLGVLRDAFGHRPILLISRQGEHATDPINGYLPLAFVSSLLFGRFLVSLPYLNQAGVVADDPQVASSLVDHAVQLAESHQVKYLELRHGEPVSHAKLELQNDQKVRMVLELPDNADILWKHLSAKVRNQVRKGQKESLIVRWGARELLNDFYDIFAINMRDLGTPVYSRELFGTILDRFGDQAELAVVSWQEQPVAGALLIHDKSKANMSQDPSVQEMPGLVGGTTRVPSASSLRSFNHLCANMWMYHQLLLRSIERGSSAFDFGRSSVDSGTYQFKKQWGAIPHSTVWQYHVLKGDISTMRPDSPSNRRKVELWQKLPIWLTRLVGPRIVRGIP